MNSKFTKKICIINDRMLRRLYSMYVFVLNVEKRDNNLFVEFINIEGKKNHVEFSRSKVYKTFSISNTRDMEYEFIINAFR